MKKAVWLILAATLTSLVISCDESIDESNSSARVTGYVFQSRQDPSGVSGVQIIMESDIESDNPYLGPDRWFTTDENGYFEAAMFIGTDPETGERDYVADFLIQYFYDGQLIAGPTGGITLSPGSVFSMPPVYLSGQ
jgi:hypothetical protein